MSRTMQRLSQRELSIASGIDIKTISRIESGLISPTILTLMVLAEALKVSLDWLSYGKEGTLDPQAHEAPFSTTIAGLHDTPPMGEQADIAQLRSELAQLRDEVREMKKKP